MTRTIFKALTGSTILGLFLLNPAAAADEKYGKKPGSATDATKSHAEADHKDPKHSTTAGTSATLSATLVDKEKKAKEKSATVEVKVTGLKLTDPATVKEQPKAGQGHLHYKVDNGPVIASTMAKLSLHDLTPGAHKIIVMLVGNDHQPLGPEQTLEVQIP